MNIVDWLNAIGGIISIVAFVASAWIWLQSRHKLNEMLRTIQAMYDISGSIQWELHSSGAEDDTTRLRQAQKSLGLVSAIHILGSKYVKDPQAFPATEFGMLLQRGVILTPRMLWDIEVSGDTTEIWLVTPDLEPDASDEITGRLVASNLAAGKRYVYFYPSALADADEQRARLVENVGVKISRAAQVTFVPVDRARHHDLFQRGNSILFFRKDPGLGLAHAFEEVVLTKVSQRGAFWQEHHASVADGLRRVLSAELRESKAV